MDSLHRSASWITALMHPRIPNGNKACNNGQRCMLGMKVISTTSAFLTNLSESG